MPCDHDSVECVNHYEIVRKYRCVTCGEVMMCACEERFARQYLPHQISRATDFRTKQKIPVTAGFQPMICNTCRGLPEEPHPKKPLYGNTSKIARYYWREIQMATIERFASLVKEKGESDWLRVQANYKKEYDECKRQVIADIKEQHSRQPKYVYDERSQSEVLSRCNVPVVRLEGVYEKTQDGRLRIRQGTELLSPEEYAGREIQSQGFKVLFTESVPFHALFGVMMWLLVQDPSDPRVRMVMFGDRNAFEKRQSPNTVHAMLPEDFGGPSYAARRASAIREHMASLAVPRSELLWIFDYWIEPSESLRQYLWAHRPRDVATARTILTVLPEETTIRILDYLIGDYWGRYCGWPDLLIYKNQEFRFVEVKSSKDKLSQDQMDWVEGNTEWLGLPFEVVKIHKRERM